MRTGWLFLAACVAACTAGADNASDLDEERNVAVPDPSPTPPVTDAGTTTTDASDDVEGPCDDCEHFPRRAPRTSSARTGRSSPITPAASTRGRGSASSGVALRTTSGSPARSARSLATTARRGSVKTSGRASRSAPCGSRVLRDRAATLHEGLRARRQHHHRHADHRGGWLEFVPTYTAPSPPGASTAHIVASWAAPGDEFFWSIGKGPSPGGIHRLRVGATMLEGTSLLTAAVCNASSWCRSMNSVHGASADTLWIVGESGATVRVTNATAATPTVTEHDSQTWSALQGVWAASATEAWAVGALGTIRHYTGGARWASSRTSPRTSISTRCTDHRRPTCGPSATAPSSSTTTARSGLA